VGSKAAEAKGGAAAMSTFVLQCNFIAQHSRSRLSPFESAHFLIISSIHRF
jgi:hypothetical protein